MKSINSAFLQMLMFLKRDLMLLVVCISPLLIGTVFKWGIPMLENGLCGYFKTSSILMAYYQLFDMVFSMLTAFMFCYVTAMIILEERDNGIVDGLCVTPLGRRGYLIARLGLPGVIGFCITLCLLPIFSLTDLNIMEIFFISILGSLQGMIAALLIVTISSNKLEGMAVAKMSSIITMGVFVPYFIKGLGQYCACMLPSFWLGKSMVDGKFAFMIVGIGIALLWIYCMTKKFKRR